MSVFVMYIPLLQIRNNVNFPMWLEKVHFQLVKV